MRMLQQYTTGVERKKRAWIKHIWCHSRVQKRETSGTGREYSPKTEIRAAFAHKSSALLVAWMTLSQ